MCCFRLHFSDFNLLFFQKIENLLQFTLGKNNLFCKKGEKTCRDEKSQPPPLDIKWSVPNRYYNVGLSLLTGQNRIK